LKKRLCAVRNKCTLAHRIRRSVRKSLNRLKKKPEDTPQKTDNKQENKAQGQQKSLVDFLLADKEQSLILLLLLLLSGEKADPSLLLALMYLLM
jgi:hypothetical protein